jgi:hypothetical protein
MGIKDCLGKWILWDISHLRDGSELDNTIENLVKVVEFGVDKLSKSGEYVRVFTSAEDDDQSASWFKVSEFEPYMIEILGNIEYENLNNLSRSMGLN